MTLTTHAITGAAIATMVPNYPALGFILGFGSHYILHLPRSCAASVQTWNDILYTVW